MAAGTDAKKLNMTNKRVLSLVDLKDRLFGYNLDKATDTIKRIFPTDGNFGVSVALTSSGAADNKVNIAAALAFEGTDGLGNIIRGDAADSRLQGIEIPPDAGQPTYYLSLIAAIVEDPHTGDSENPVIADGTGTLQYQNFVEDIGYVQAPTSVTDDGDGTITMNVNSLFASGEDHSGRTVRVWLASTDDGGPGPQTAEKAGSFPASVDVCFDEVTVTFDSPDNEISISHNFGQETTSTTASDYKVMLVGPRVSQTNLFNEAGEFGIGTARAEAASTQITVVSTVDQANVNFDLALLANITRTGTNGDLKVQVTTHASDSNEHQISVYDGSSTVFWVDEDGDVYIDGDLEVNGTETINSSQTVTGDVTIGDGDDDLTIDAVTTFLTGSHIHIGASGVEDEPDVNIIWESDSYNNITLEYDGDDQLTLYRNDADGTASKFRVMQKGAGGGFGIETDGGVTITDGSTDYDVDIAASHLVCTVSSSSERKLRLVNSGTGAMSLELEGKIELLGTHSESGLIDAVSSTLTFADDNCESGVPLSSSTATALDSGGSIVGDINALFTLQSNVRHNGVVDLNGLVVSDGIGDSVDISTGSASVEGVIYDYTGTTNVVTSGSGTQNNFVYIDGADGVIKVTTTKATAFSLSNLVLAVCDGAGGANVINFRPGVPRLNQSPHVSIGYDNNPNARSDFATIEEAFNFIRFWDDQVATTRRPRPVIYVTGPISMPSAAIELYDEHDGVIVRGTNRTNSELVGNGSTELFEFQSTVTSCSVVFEDLKITQASQIFMQGAGSYSGVSFSGRHLIVESVNSATVFNLSNNTHGTFELYDSKITHSGGSAARVFALGTDGDEWLYHIENNEFDIPTTNDGSSTYNEFGGRAGSTFRGNKWDGGRGLTFSFLAVGFGNWDHNYFENLPRGIEIRDYVGSLSYNVMRSIGSNGGASASSGSAIEVSEVCDVDLTGNDCEMVSGADAACVAITDTGTCKVRMNGGRYVGSTDAPALDVTSSGTKTVTVNGGYYENDNTSSGTIRVTSQDYCAVVGASIRNDHASGEGVILAGTADGCNVSCNAINANTKVSDTASGTNVVANNS